MTYMTASSDLMISLVIKVRYWYDLHDSLFQFKDFSGRQSEVLV